MRARTQRRIHRFIKIHRQSPIPLIAIDIIRGDFVGLRAGAGEGDGEFYADGREGEDAWLALDGGDEIGGRYDVEL